MSAMRPRSLLKRGTGPGSDGAATPETVRLDGRSIEYLLLRRRRRSIGFVVGPGGLRVQAPVGIARGTIDAALQAKARWILAKLAEQRERDGRAAAERVAWQDGGRLTVLGVPTILRLDPALRNAAFDPAGPDDANATLRLPLPVDAAADRVEAAAGRWLRTEALRVFDERCAFYAPRLGVRPTRLRLTSARTRWGSASIDGSIRLNLRLIHLPLPQLDYVVVHELAHLREMNHGPRFWAIVASVLPDHLARRRELRQVSWPAPKRQ